MRRHVVFLLMLIVPFSDANADDVAQHRVRMETRLRAIADEVFKYFISEWPDKDGNIVLWRLPPATSLTPAKPCCAQRGQLCTGKRGWDQRGWKALLNDVSEPSPTPYRFKFTTKGQGKSASFVVRAVGDPQCDGHEEVWELAVGWADADDQRVDTAITRVKCW